MEVKKFFVHLLFFFSIINVNSEEIRYKCGIYDDNIPELPATHYNTNHSTDKRRAETESEQFQDFHIYLKLYFIASP